MNFFQQQQLARRNTRMMLLLYVLAVIAVVLAVDLVLAAAWRWGFPEIYGAKVPTKLYVWGALGTFAVILGATIYHVVRLREGGDAIARMAGARRVTPDTRDTLERRLMNVVEEMAIAAGMRVPAVYVMHEEAGINAFAAGYDVSNSVIAVTRGTLQTLNRDELQAVVAHEFSHILNGDVRLNIRMMGVLGGIVFIGAIGEFMMRATNSRSRRDSNTGIFLVGLALMLIGYIGLFFARLIKAAVSRQREYLADAASVQFTRNPSGIAGALDQIRASGAGTLVDNRFAEDMSHMFFGQSVKLWFGGLFDTHPPLDERIRRVLPSFGATQYRSKRRTAADATLMMPAMNFGAGKRPGDQSHAWGRSIAQSVALVGTMEGEKVDYARGLLERLPPPVREAARRQETAPALLVGMMLAAPPDVMAKQLEAAAAANVGLLAEAAREMAPLAMRLPPEMQLPVVDLALPAVKAAPPQAQAALLRALEAVIYADRRVSLHEFVVLTLVRAQLAPPSKPLRQRSISQMQPEIQLIVSLLAHGGRGAGAAAEQEVALAFQAGAKQLGLNGAAIVPRAKLSLQACAEALKNLNELAPLAKAELVGALFAAVTADGKLRVSEAELMRMVGATLGCPVPPLFESL